MMRLIILAAGLLALSSLFQPGGAETTASCKGQQSCTACLTAHSDCAWCKTERSEGFPYDHCDLSPVIARLCPPADIVFPRSSVEAVKNTSLSEQQSPSQPVQVAPQHLRLKLRPHERKEFEVKFRQVADYPLDLYYLMDLTVSMREDKETLVALGEDMTILLRRLTKNFRLGFGSFVDKPVMPYVSQAAGTKENPCALYKDITCVPAYGFRNHLNLSNQVNRFTEKVRQAEVSANLDDLEGGLDALVQVATCSDVIGWNKKSRKLIIYTSDGLFHLAGEGLLGGAAMRNELACKLSDDGYYEGTRTHDYPSVAELDRVLRRENMNVVFAVFSDVRKEYDKLAELMKASVQVESLLDDSSNILSVIKRQYESITSRIELVDDSGDEIAIRYRSSCLDNELKLRNNCTGIKTGDLVTFSIEVEVLGCPKQKNHTIHLKDVLTSETVRLDVEIVCECDCERPELVQTNSPKCSGVGALQCGVCDCPDGRAGWSCECSETLGGQSCLPDNSTSGPECSGRGECVCGKCECHAGSTFNITGQFCQCDSRLCDRAPNGLICGGEQHGRCECNQCVCRPGWTGDDCYCSNDTRNCVPPGSSTDLVCNGKGDCVCGRCHCVSTDEGRYAGLFCEDCPTCRGLCRTYQPCVECRLRTKAGTGHNCSSCPETDTHEITLTERLASPEDGTMCRFQDALDGCFYQFQYYSDERGITVINVIKSKECYEVDVLAIVLSTVGSVVTIGVITLLLWRLYTYLADRREYAKFELEVKAMNEADSGMENELYRNPVTRYRVPEGVMAKLEEED